MPIFVVTTAVTFVKLLCRWNLSNSIFSWLGAMSGVLFVVHPAVREVLIGRTNVSGNYYGMLFVYLFVTIGLSIILKPVFGGGKKQQKPADSTTQEK